MGGGRIELTAFTRENGAEWTGVGRTATALMAVLCLVASIGELSAEAPELEALFPTPRYVHLQWTTADGLPVGSVNVVTQTTDGWIWIGTNDGLVRFDGVEFERFSTVEAPELGSNRIVRLMTHPDGSLWILTEAGRVTRFAEGLFTNPTTADGRVPRMTSFAVGPRGATWVGGFDGLYSVEDAQTLVLEVPSDQGVVALAFDSSGQLWSSGSFGRLAVVESGSSRWMGESLPLPPGRFWVTGIVPRDDGSVWVGTSLGLWRFTGSVHEKAAPASTPATCSDLRTRITWGVGGGSYRHCLVADDGAVWSRTPTVIGRNGVEIARLGDSGVILAGLFVDREGIVWLPSTNGLHSLVPARVRMLDESRGLTGGNSYPIHQDGDGVVWAGVWGHGLFRVAAGAVDLHQRVTSVYSALYEDPLTGELLWGAYAGFGSVTSGQVFDQEVGIVRAILRIMDDRLLLGTETGLKVSRPGDPGPDGWRFTVVPGTEAWTVRALLEDSAGVVWMGTVAHGVGRWDGMRASALTMAEGLSSDAVRALHLDDRGALWIGTEDRGLNRLLPSTLEHSEGPRIDVFQARHGLWDNGIHKVIEEPGGWLWMSSNQGIFRVRRGDLERLAGGEIDRVHPVVFTESEGMNHREANGGVQDAGIRAADSTLWFPTQRGVAIIDPQELDGAEPPPVVLKGVVAGGDRQPLNGGPLTLAAEQRDFEIDYTALSFRSPDRTHFRYRLNDYDRDWVEAGARRTAFYGQVPAGSYRFEVQALSSEGVWNREGAGLDVTVRPFYWETLWFRGLLGVLALALIAGVFVIRDRGQRAVRRRLERKVRERTRELARERDVVVAQAERLAELDDMKSQLFANVSHEFRTPLTLALGPLKDLETGVHGDIPPDVFRQIRLVRRNTERILSLVEQLLDTARADSGRLSIRARRLDLVEFLKKQSERFTGLAERRGLDLRFVTAVDRLEIWGDPDQLDKILANLLSNAMRATERGGSVELVLEEPPGDGTVAIIVRDTGYGIKQSELDLIFDRFYRVERSLHSSDGGTGLGLPLARQVAELHGGTLTVASEVGVGSVFRVVLALGREHFSASQIADEAIDGPKKAPPEPHLPAPDSAGTPPSSESTSPLEGILDDRVTVLVVDDHPDIRSYVRRHLEESFRVLEAGDGAEGYRVARESLPDLVLTDLMMPEMNGMELTRKLKADPELDYVPVVLLTARGSAEAKLESFAEGADDYLTKPFDAAELVARVDNLIRQRQRLRERFAAGDGAPPIPSLSHDELGAEDRAFLERIRAALNEGLADEDFNVERLASAVAMDRTGLFRRLRATAGSTPSELILETRLARAAELLLRQEGGVGEVAVAVGFKSVAHFSERFRKRFGSTPSAYRNRLAQEGSHQDH